MRLDKKKKNFVGIQKLFLCVEKKIPTFGLSDISIHQTTNSKNFNPWKNAVNPFPQQQQQEEPRRPPKHYCQQQSQQQQQQDRQHQ